MDSIMAIVWANSFEPTPSELPGSPLNPGSSSTTFSRGPNPLDYGYLISKIIQSEFVALNPFRQSGRVIAAHYLLSSFNQGANITHAQYP